MRTAIWITLGVTCAWPVFAQDGAKPKADAPATGAAAPAPAADAAPKLSDYDVLKRRNPFSPVPEYEPKPTVKKPVKKPDPTPVKKRETRDEVSKNLTITGVVMPRAGSDRPFAIVEEDGEKPRQIRQGDKFLKGMITTVSMDGVTILLDGKAKVFKLGEPFADGTKTHKVYVDNGERVDGGAGSGKSSPSSGSSSSGGSSAKKSGGISSLLSEEERKLPDAERRKLLMKRMKERRAQQRAAKGK